MNVKGTAARIRLLFLIQIHLNINTNIHIMLYQIYKYKYARQGLCSKGQFAYQKIARGSLCWPRTETGLCRFIIIIMTITIVIIAIILITTITKITNKEKLQMFNTK